MSGALGTLVPIMSDAELSWLLGVQIGAGAIISEEVAGGLMGLTMVPFDPLLGIVVTGFAVLSIVITFGIVSAVKKSVVTYTGAAHSVVPPLSTAGILTKLCRGYTAYRRPRKRKVLGGRKPRTATGGVGVNRRRKKRRKKPLKRKRKCKKGKRTTGVVRKPPSKQTYAEKCRNLKKARAARKRKRKKPVKRKTKKTRRPRKKRRYY